MHYRLSVPRADLGISGEPGVYWVGVHVLGADAGRPRPRSRTAGRAPSCRCCRARAAPRPAGPDPAGAGRAAEEAGADGERRASGGHRLVAADTLSPDGRLDRLLSLTGRARRPFTWVVDPAVLDAVRSLARGNPSADPAPGAGADPGDGPASSPSAGSSDDPSRRRPQGARARRPGTTRRPRSVAGRARRGWPSSAGRRRRPRAPSRRCPTATSTSPRRSTTAMAPIYRQGVSLSRAAMAGLGVDDVRPVVDPASGRAATDRR